MNAPANPLQPALPPTWPMYRAMVGIGLVCGLLIVSVYLLTGPAIARNKAEALERAIFEVLPDARSTKTFRWDGARFVAVESAAAGERVYAGYDEAGRLVGLAVEAAGMGYQDVIGVLYGYSFDDDALIGLRVLESKETPGLGDRIETDPEFTANFERLAVPLSADLSTVVEPIVTVKHGRKQQPWQVDGITGATISSVAIGKILGASTGEWVPRIRQHLDEFRGGE